MSLRLALACALAPLGVPHLAAAEVGECHVVDVKFTPGMRASTQSERHEPSQIVIWLESPTGEFKRTMYITQDVGRYGLGNRPGRFDFNSGPMWPYGRRETVFPVWAHRKPETFPAVVFRNCCGYSLPSDDPAYCEMLKNDDPSPGDRAFSDC